VIRVLIGLIVVAAIASALTSGDADHSAPATRSRPLAPVGTPATSQLEHAEIDRQDRTTPAQRRREARAFDARRLLTALPIVRAGVRIDIAGLDRDGHTTVLSISAGRRSCARARAVYRRVLAEHGDRGTNYRLRWQR
jgi:hypothetical protein